MEDEIQNDIQDLDDDSTTPAAHNKLLGAVSELYEKKRVKASTRKEPSLEVSEFHLSKPDKKHSRIKVSELAKVLNQRATHADISQKLKNAHKRAKTLPKPLEKIHQDKINRKAGFEHAKQQLNRWDAIVYKQKVADQLSFPLKNDTIKVQESADVSTLFRKPTELEIELAKVLNKPYQPPHKEEKEEEKINKHQEEEDYPLTLKEIIEKRKMMAKLRAQKSYQQAKDARHSKIKSKKFHQIRRKARVKEQLQEFEELQKKDPEAALKKLEELERTRAEERVTLRHKSTGQWAKNLAVRAKYDKEARIALSEQLSKSRELTVKLGKSQESDSENEVEEQQPLGPEEDPNNPWIAKQSKEMEDFVSGYRKYWESQGKEQEKVQNVDTSVKVNSYQEITDNPICEDLDEGNHDHPPVPSQVDKENATSNSRIDSFHSPETIGSDASSEAHREKLISPVKTDSPLSKNLFIVNDCSGQEQEGIKEIKSCSKFRVTHSVKKKEIKIGSLNKTEKLPKSSKVSQIKTNVGSWIISNKQAKSLPQQKTKEHRKLKNISSSFNVTEIKPTNNTIHCDDKNQDAKLASCNNERQQNRKNKTLDELFEEVEDKLQNKVKEKVEHIKKKLNNKRPIGDDSESESEGGPSLEFKKRISLADVDEELIQAHGNKTQERMDSDLSKTLTTVTQEVKQTENIDPNKFLKVTQRHLMSQIPEIMTEGDDALDDEESAAKDRHLTISEAFADDDVVDQFQKEKDEEVKKNTVGKLGSGLPGWGSWAGPNMRPMARRKRKKFVIKLPKIIPRRDTNRGNVIINEDADKPVKEHQVSEVPFPFTSVEEYEASVRAPLGSTWMPQTAHAKLTLPPVVTKMGAVIPPMDESVLVSVDDSSSPKKKKKKLQTKKKKKQ